MIPTFKIVFLILQPLKFTANVFSRFLVHEYIFALFMSIVAKNRQTWYPSSILIFLILLPLKYTANVFSWFSIHENISALLILIVEKLDKHDTYL